MKKIITKTIAAAGIAAGASAYATGASQGFYIGANIGSAWNQLWNKTEANELAQSGSSGTDTVTSKSENALAWGLFAGYNFALAPNWLVGGQVGYSGLGSSTYHENDALLGHFDTKFSLSAVNILLTGTYSVQAGPGFFHVGPEIGAAIGMINPSQSSHFGGEDGNTQTKVLFVLGGTAGYQWNNIDMFLRYDHYFGSDFKVSSNIKDNFPSINAVFAGLAYTF